MADDLWIVIPNWHRFQHYGLARHPPWIKNYTALLHKDEYLDLTLAERGLLHGIWLAYAIRRGRLRRSDLASSIGRARVPQRNLDSLQRAGLIEFSTSRPLPLYLELEELDARVSEPATAPRRDRDVRERVEAWIASGVASEIPADRLPAVIADEFKLEDEPHLVADLVVRALEFRR